MMPSWSRFFRLRAALLAGAALAAWSAAAGGAAPPRTLLLVDDHDVLYRSGTRRVLHPVQRRPEPVLTQERPWEITLAYNSVLRDPATGRYRMWYQALGSVSPESAGIAYAESDDGVRWRKPDLGLVPYQGGDSNLVLALAEGHYGASVVFDPRDPDPDRRYKLACFRAGEVAGRRVMGLAAGFSPDGLRWRLDPEFPLLPGNYGRRSAPPLAGDAAYEGGVPHSVSDVIDVMYDAPRGVFAIYAKTWLDMPEGLTFWKRAIARTESRDFRQWSRPVLVMQPDEFDGDGVEYRPPVRPVHPNRRGVQLHGGPVFLHEGVYFALLQKMDGETTGRMPIELAVSRDGLDWQRPFRAVDFIGLSPEPDRFDSGCLWTNATPVVLEDEIRFYYGGYSGRWNGDLLRRPSGIGLGTIPRDRFAGVRPIGEVGQVTFRPLDLGGRETLTVNAAVAGRLRVEVLDERGYGLPGFTRDDAVPVTGDALRHAVRWKEKTLRDLPAGRKMLRVHLEDAELFAVSLR
ncbi:MAG: hypothetical protein JNG83_07655 [Opitutaceae bacterium]|nr:hypothetical protein [Opitutaceae bacterium]